jgi:putative hemolysin
MPDLGLLTPASPLQSPDLFPFQRFVRRFMPLERVRELYHRAQQPVNRSILENVLAELRVAYNVSDSDLARVPAAGPVVVTANHPFGLLDGAVLGALLARVRPDVKVLTNFMLAGIPELHEHCIFVDPFGETGSAIRNRRGMKQALAWLSAGGVLVMFPAGEVSHFRFSDPGSGITDPEWNSMAARLIRITGAAALPVFLPGQNSATFQALGLLHSQLRTAWLPSEFLQQTDRTVEVRMGSRIPAETLRSVGSDRDATNYLRWRTYILAERGHPEWGMPPLLTSVFTRRKSQPVADSAPADIQVRGVEKLGSHACLFENREFSVYSATACEIPDLLQEVRRLREITFRAVGEGTGKRIDLDRFDHYYTHLLLWSKINRELVGAYRLGLTSEILPHMGVPGLYTSTLFRFDPRLFNQLGPALELGRSFIRPEYQKQYPPLLTLWKGIGRYLALHPQFPVLFGAVSISNGYSRWSRELIFRFFQSQETNDGLGKWVSPRRPFRPRWMTSADALPVSGQLNDLEYLVDPIADVESDGKSVPILIKHYAKLGGRMLGFNVDRDFSGVLDGLVLVDLRRTDSTLLRRYMGEDGLEAFMSYHGLHPSKEPA